MLMLINSILSSFVLMPFILVGMVMVGYNSYKFFRTHPLLGHSGKAEAITSAGVVLVVSAVIVAVPHGFLGKVGLIGMLSLVINLIYVGVALYYIKKWVMRAVRATQDDLTRRASAFHTTAFQKETMVLLALLVGSGADSARVTSVAARISASTALNHLPAATLVGYFNAYCATMETNNMFGREDLLKAVKDLPAPGDQTDVALRVAIAIAGGKNGSDLDNAVLRTLVVDLGLEPDLYSKTK